MSFPGVGTKFGSAPFAWSDSSQTSSGRTSEIWRRTRSQATLVPSALPSSVTRSLFSVSSPLVVGGLGGLRRRDRRELGAGRVQLGLAVAERRARHQEQAGEERHDQQAAEHGGEEHGAGLLALALAVVAGEKVDRTHDLVLDPQADRGRQGAELLLGVDLLPDLDTRQRIADAGLHAEEA